mgnify:CR=1 FL=1
MKKLLGRLAASLLALVLLVDFARVLPEATRIADPYYRDGVTAFEPEAPLPQRPGAAPAVTRTPSAIGVRTL